MAQVCKLLEDENAEIKRERDKALKQSSMCIAYWKGECYAARGERDALRKAIEDALAQLPPAPIRCGAAEILRHAARALDDQVNSLRKAIDNAHKHLQHLEEDEAQQVLWQALQSEEE